MKTTSSSHTTALTKILECVCSHAFQDTRYGKNMRVHNPRKSGAGKGAVKYACTVCDRVTD